MFKNVLKKCSYFDFVGLLAIIYSIGYNLCLIHIPAPVDWFSDVGNILINLSYSYFAGYVFYKFSLLLDKTQNKKWIQTSTIPKLNNLIDLYQNFLESIIHTQDISCNEWYSWSQENFKNAYDSINLSITMTNVKLPLAGDVYNVTTSDAIKNFILQSVELIKSLSPKEYFYLLDSTSAILSKFSTMDVLFYFQQKNNKDFDFWNFHHALAELKQNIQNEYS